MNAVYEGIIESLKELKAYGNGKSTGVVIHKYDDSLKPAENKPKRQIVILPDDDTDLGKTEF